MTTTRPLRTILFISSGGSGRAPMAARFVHELFGDRYRAASAGIDPREPDDLVAEVMQETGLDLPGHRPLKASELTAIPVDYLVTLCDRAKKVCPMFAACGISFHKRFSDPASFPEDPDARRNAYRSLRDDIRDWVEQTFG